MRIGYREVVFSTNSYCAAILALYVSFVCDLERPYWAMMTAYIVSQPFTGAVHSKAVYRILGTVLGAAIMVFAIPPLSNAPLLLSGCIAAWVGICLYFSLLDRTPRSYVFLLAGYTAVFIGIPVVTAPLTAFDVAVARVEEIAIGVLCATFFHTVFFPHSLRQILTHQFSDATADLQSWICDTLARKKDAVRRRGRIRLAADITDLHLVATHIPFDTHEPQQVYESTHILQNTLIKLFPIITGISDRLKRMEADGKLPEDLTQVLTDLIAWMHLPPEQQIAQKNDIQKRCIALKKIQGPPNWQDMLMFNISTRLSELTEAYIACRHTVETFAKEPARHPVRKTYVGPTERRLLHTDTTAALYNALACFAIVLSGALLWIVSGRPEGSTAVMMAGVTYCLFASQTNPVPAQKTCMYYTVLSGIVAGIYQFFIFPYVHSFATLSLVLAPVLLTCGILVAQPKVGGKYQSFVIPFCGSLMLTRHFSPDFESYLTFNAAQCIGIAAVVGATRILHRFSARKCITSVLRATWLDIAALAHGTRRMRISTWLSLMVDRIGLLAPYVDVIKTADDLKHLNAMCEMRTGLNIIRLSRAAQRLPEDIAQETTLLLQAIARHYEHLAMNGANGDPPDALLRHIDANIAMLSAMPANRHKETIFNALTGLRCNLFPNAWPYMYGITWHD